MNPRIIAPLAALVVLALASTTAASAPFHGAKPATSHQGTPSSDDAVTIIDDRDYTPPGGVIPTAGSPVQAGAAPIPPPRATDQILPAGGVWRTSTNLLRTSFEAWATQAGFHVIWQIEGDRRVAVPLSFEGSFVDAASQLISLYHRGKNPLTATIHMQNRVVVVTERN